MSSKCGKNILDLFCVPLSEDIPQCTEEFKKSFRVVDKGSLTLRSKEHVYSDGVLKNNWFVEDRPKDFDFKTACPRSLHRSTYRRLGCSRDPTPLTVYGFTNKEMFKLHAIPPPPISHRDPSNLNDRQCIMIERDGAVADESGKRMVLPRHSEDPKKLYAVTTNWDTYRPQLPYLFVSRDAEDLIKEHEEEIAMEFVTACNKKCVSQFTDLNGTKTQGTNNWQDESGIYANSSLRTMNPLYTKTEPPFSTRLV